jgi:hypothetical protein
MGKNKNKKRENMIRIRKESRKQKREKKKIKEREEGYFAGNMGHAIYTKLENMEVDGKKSRICLPHACGCCLSPVVILQSVVFMIRTVFYHEILFTEIHICFIFL